MPQGQMRQNRATKKWVIYAPARSKRPRDYARGEKKASGSPPKDENCPFCPGNEDMLPGILHQEPSIHGEMWQTRVVPNKYPALIPETEFERTTDGFHIAMPGYGKHEVIVESPRHDLDLAQLSLDEVGNVIDTYQRRYITSMEDPKIRQVILFRNHGSKAGTSLEHPHSQLIATGLVPSDIRRQQEVAQEYFDDWGRCLYCEMLTHEKHDKRRVILENASFLAFVPYAAEVPFEIWIVPTMHQADFIELSKDSMEDFSHALRGALILLESELGDPDYNYVINSASRYHRESPFMHWFLQIRPRITTQAGFEIGSGMLINPSLPEENAAYLRGENG